MILARQILFVQTVFILCQLNVRFKRFGFTEKNLVLKKHSKIMNEQAFVRIRRLYLFIVLVFMFLQCRPFENTVGKGEIALNE